MPIDTISQWHPKFALPVYTKIVWENMNDYTVGDIYEMRMEDEENADDRAPFNYVHEAMLICKRRINIGDTNDMLLAFDLLTRSREEAMEKLVYREGEMLLLVFLRVDMAKKMVENGLDALDKDILVRSLEAET